MQTFSILDALEKLCVCVCVCVCLSLSLSVCEERGAESSGRGDALNPTLICFCLILEGRLLGSCINTYSVWSCPVCFSALM
jgi:hypothetical protein